MTPETDWAEKRAKEMVDKWRGFDLRKDIIEQVAAALREARQIRLPEKEPQWPFDPPVPNLYKTEYCRGFNEGFDSAKSQCKLVFAIWKQEIERLNAPKPCYCDETHIHNCPAHTHLQDEGENNEG